MDDITMEEGKKEERSRDKPEAVKH